MKTKKKPKKKKKAKNQKKKTKQNFLNNSKGTGKIFILK